MKGGRIVADDTPHVLMASDGNEDVAELMAMPRRQAERVRALLEDDGEARGDG
jgi:osmoprotectant transport system ATP-binding protein